MPISISSVSSIVSRVLAPDNSLRETYKYQHLLPTGLKLYYTVNQTKKPRSTRNESAHLRPAYQHNHFRHTMPSPRRDHRPNAHQHRPIAYQRPTFCLPAQATCSPAKPNPPVPPLLRPALPPELRQQPSRTHQFHHYFAPELRQQIIRTIRTFRT